MIAMIGILGMIQILQDYSEEPFSDVENFFIYTLVMFLLAILFVKYFGIDNSIETIGLFFSLFLIYLCFTGVIETIYMSIALIIIGSIFYSISKQQRGGSVNEG